MFKNGGLPSAWNMCTKFSCKKGSELFCTDPVWNLPGWAHKWSPASSGSSTPWRCRSRLPCSCACWAGQPPPPHLLPGGAGSPSCWAPGPPAGGGTPGWRGCRPPHPAYQGLRASPAQAPGHTQTYSTAGACKRSPKRNHQAGKARLGLTCMPVEPAAQ